MLLSLFTVHSIVCVYAQMVIGIYEQISGLESELSKAVERDQNSVTTNVSE